MSLIQGDFGNMIHGVSQQPDERKAKGQVREQINCRSHVTKGLESRASFEFIAELIPDASNAGSLDNAKWVSQQRGDGKDFIVAYDVSRPCVFNTDGVRLPFAFTANAEQYYKHNLTDPNQNLSVDAVLDTTFISNREMIPTGDDFNDNINDPLRVTWIEFKTFQAGTEIEIAFGTIVGGYYTHTVFDGFVTVDPSSGEPDPADAERTKEYEGSWHAENFVTQAVSLDVIHYNNWVRISHPNLTPVRVIKGGDSIEIHENKSIDSAEKLPPFAIEGDKCKVNKERDDEKSLGYFTAVSRKNDVDYAEVAWEETTATNSSGVLNAETMPHTLVRDLSDNFTLQAIDWEVRQTGDKDSNPYPSFIEAKTAISNVGIFQNRLYLTSNEIVFMSASDAFYDLWRESSFYNTDADPFEVFADTNQLNIIRYAEDFDGDLVLFSPNGQFLMSGEISHTYNTAVISSASQFKSDFNSDPVLSGDNIFFATNYGNFAGVRELYTDGTDRTKRALPVTQHVDEYISGSISHMATSTDLDVLCCLNSNDPDSVFIYEWIRTGDSELKQQAWHKWKLQENVEVVWVNFIENSLYAVVKLLQEGATEPTFYLWKLDWDDPDTTHGLHFSVSLDARFTVSSITYDPIGDTSQFNTPYDRADLVFVEGVESEDTGFEAPAVRIGAYTWEVDGDYSDMTLIGGLKYKRLVEFPNPQIKDSDGASKGIDRLQLSKMFLHFTKVGQMAVSIEDSHGRIREYTYNNRRVGLPNNQPSYINIGKDTWDFGVRKKAEGLTMTLTSDDVVPFELRAIEWRGNFKPKGKR